MNRFLAIQGCIAVFSAFLLGPFTHVHEAVGHDDHPGEERAAIVHSHISFDAPDIVESSQTTVSQPRHRGQRQLTIFDFQKQSPAPQPSLVTFPLYAPEMNRNLLAVVSQNSKSKEKWIWRDPVPASDCQIGKGRQA